jgi:hypothetical protein
VDRVVKDIRIGEGLVSEVAGFQIAPDDLDVVEFRRVFWQPLDGEPVGAFGERGKRRLAQMDRAVVEYEDDRLKRRARLRTIEAVEELQMGDEVDAALGAGGGDDKLALCAIERADHGDLLGLSGRRHAQIRAALGPGAGEIGMGESFTLVGEQKDDVASLGLRLAQFEPQSNAIDGVFVLTPFQGVPRATEAKPPFWRRTFESCDLEIVTPSRLAISSAKRARVQLGRSATGADKSGSAIRSAAHAFNGAGPGATRALRASIPPLMKSLRHSRTVSSRTPNASAIRALVQPKSVSKIARARSASPRSAPPARALSAALCSSVAVTGDLPAMPRPPNQRNERNHGWQSLASLLKPA